MKITLNAFFILCISALVSNAFASLPDPIDPKASVNFSFEQRIAHTRQLYAQLKGATSAERLAYFEKSIETIKKLTPEERLVLSEKFKSKYDFTSGSITVPFSYCIAKANIKPDS